MKRREESEESVRRKQNTRTSSRVPQFGPREQRETLERTSDEEATIRENERHEVSNWNSV